VVLLLVIIPVFILPLSDWPVLVVMLVVILLYGSIYFILPLITHRKRGGVKERYDAELEAEMKSPPGIATHVNTRFGRHTMTMFSFFLAATLLAYFAGRGEASRQKDYLITNTSPEMVVLRVHGDSLICAPFDRSTKEVWKQFTVFKLSEESRLALNLEGVGPLNPVRKPSEAPPPVPTTTPVEAPSVTPTLTPSTPPSPAETRPEPENKDSAPRP